METDTFRYYGGENEVPGYLVEFTKEPAEPVTKMPLYPPMSVDDHTPGWDTVRFPPRPENRR